MFMYSKHLYLLTNVFMRSFDIFQICRPLLFRPSNIDKRAELDWKLKNHVLVVPEKYDKIHKLHNTGVKLIYANLLTV